MKDYRVNTLQFPVLLGLLFLFILPVKHVTAAPQYLIKFATVAPEGSTWMKTMRSLDKEIRKKSGGEVGLRIYAGGIAGDELDVLKKIRIGQIHCAAFSGVGFGKILPMVRVLDLPFLFRNYQETDLVHRQLRPYFVNEFRKKGFELISWAEVGNVHLFSKKPFRKIKDLSGLKVWTWSGDPIAKETFSSMGINPIPLAITDVTTAINTGMIDTVYAPPLGALALQWQTEMKHMTMFPLVHSTGAILISSRYFKKLPINIALIFTTAFNDAMTDLTSTLREQSREAIDVIKEGGLNVTPLPSGDHLDEFNMIHDKVAQNLKGKIFSEELLGRVYQILGRSKK